MQHFNFTCHWPLQLHSNWDQPATLCFVLSCLFGSLWTTSQLHHVGTEGEKKHYLKPSTLQVWNSFTQVCRHHCPILIHEDCKGIKQNKRGHSQNGVEHFHGATQSQSAGKNSGVSWKHFTWFHTLPSVKGKQSKSPFAQGNSGTEVII